MDQSLLYMIGAGVLALVLIILILRFAMRPKKTAAPQQTGLGLPVNPGTSSGGAESKPLSSFTPSVAEMRAAEAAAQRHLCRAVHREPARRRRHKAG